jgi:2,3-bisphosphoglycerate-independent phosphoglycerate mutase
MDVTSVGKENCLRFISKWSRNTFKEAVATVEESYSNNVTDEFIDPITIIDSNDKPMATIEEDDVVIFFNFRTDRRSELLNGLA